MYYIIFIYLLGLFILPKQYRKTKILLALIPILGIVVLRYGIGADYFSYKYIYMKTADLTFANSMSVFPEIDKGFLLLFKGLQLLNLSYHSAISIIASVCVTLVAYWIYQNEEDLSLSILLYYGVFFFVWHLSAIRQGIVISVSLLTLFNRKLKLPKFAEVIIILILASIHLSALILLVFLVLDRLKLTRKKHLIILGASLLVTMLPLHLILSNLTFIPGVSRVLLYFDGSFGFFKFSGLSRLFLFLIVWYHYDSITHNEYDKHICDTYLIGLSMYFIMNFSEVAAGRFVVYSFILLLTILPMIVRVYQGKMRYLALSAAVLFSGAYLVKDLNTMRFQTEMDTKSKLIPFTNIFDKDKVGFKSYFKSFTDNMVLYNERYESFIKMISSRELTDTVDAQEGDSFTAYYSTKYHNYMILNQKGETVGSKLYKYEPKIHGNYLKYFEDETDKEMLYYDIIRSEFITDSEIINDIDKADRIPREEVSVRKANMSEFKDTVQKLIPNLEKVGDVFLFEYDQPMKHYIIDIQYHYNTVRIMLDENMDPMFDDYYLKFSTFDGNGFIQAHSSVSVELYHVDGSLIWIRKH